MSQSIESFSKALDNETISSRLSEWFDYHFPKNGAKRKGSEGTNRLSSLARPNQHHQSLYLDEGKSFRPPRNDDQASTSSSRTLASNNISNSLTPDSRSQSSTLNVASFAPIPPLAERAPYGFLSSLASLSRNPSKLLRHDHYYNAPHPWTSQQDRAWTGASIQHPKRPLLVRLFTRRNDKSVTRSERHAGEQAYVQRGPRIPAGGEAARASVAAQLNSHRLAGFDDLTLVDECLNDTESGIAVDLSSSLDDLTALEDLHGKFIRSQITFQRTNH